METECNQKSFDFQPLSAREVTARFDGGTIVSDAGALLLREVEDKAGILQSFAACFDDFRDPELIEFSVEELLKQRVFALCLGYEDLNDHETLRRDPLLAVLAGRSDPTGQDRVAPRDRGAALAGKSTLNRLELTPPRGSEKSRYKKIAARHAKLDSFFVETFLKLTPEPPEEIVLDLDATDDPLHGNQLGRFFHGYYDGYCYLPLYIFAGEHLLCAKLRPANIDASAGATKQVARIVEQIRGAWPGVRIILRGDSGFCREELMAWCEENQVDYLFGLAKNRRLLQILGGELHQAQQNFEVTREPVRVFKEFEYQTRKSWSRARRVIGKAEHLAKGANPRFVVTSLRCREPGLPSNPAHSAERSGTDAQRWSPRALYEELYCARGEMENRIKEQQLCLFADRTSCHTMRANQLRLWLSGVAYVLLQTLRQHGLKETPLATARCDTIRLKLLKIGARVRVTVRRVWFSLAESYPYQELFQRVFQNLKAWFPLPATAAPA